MTAHTIFNARKGRQDRPLSEAAEGTLRTNRTIRGSAALLGPMPATISAPSPVSLKRPNRFPISAGARDFMKRFYPEATAEDWNDWRWQSRHRIRSLKDLERIFTLSAGERDAAARHTGSLPVGITPYYASLMGLDDPAEPLRRTHVMVGDEFLRTPGEEDDPLGEDHDMAAPGLVHRYPDRVLFLTTGFCATYCRYCTRARVVGNAGGEYHFSVHEWDKALAYIEEHSEIRDVLLSGGDPLSIGDDKLDHLLTRLRKIRHVEFVRMGSKIPVVLPQRITRDLLRVLRKHLPWMSIHFTHPAELSPEVTEATGRLADAGLPLGSQTVLLKGINDDLPTMKRLMHGLLQRRVKPYYLYQCDPISGSSHFRTTIDKGVEIIRGLRGHTTGYAVPTFVVDAPGGGGKIPLSPDYVAGRDGDALVLTNYEGNNYSYVDPLGQIGRTRPVRRLRDAAE
ncbi:MAG: KamA family radical SAM protein [Alphaproteobacteria bacterium]|nr:KamA family radical SAM protein [Alphaproteobacteria bacterium]